MGDFAQMGAQAIMGGPPPSDIARMLGNMFYSTAGPYAAKKAVDYLSSGPGTKKKASKSASKKIIKKAKAMPRITNSKELAIASGATAVVQTKKRARKGKSKKPSKKRGLTRKEILKMIDRKLRKGPKMLLSSVHQNEMFQLASANNVVAWHTKFLENVTDLRARLTYKMLQHVAATTAQVKIDADFGGYVGQKFYFHDTFDLSFKNNTNSPVEFVVYLMKCTQYTDTSPDLELTELRKAAFSNATSLIVKETDYDQYWSLPRINTSQRIWQISKRWQLDMSGGEEASLFIKKPIVTFDPSVVFEQGDMSYLRGDYCVVIRQQGKVTHSIGTAANMGLTNTSVDVLVSSRRKTFMQQNHMVQAIEQQANVGILAITDPVLAEPEIPDVGAFKQ